MGFFKRLKFWKRVTNCKTGVVRGILKCFVPWIRRRSRSPIPESSSSTPENKTLENCKETTHRRIGNEYEALIQAERQHEHIDMHSCINFLDLTIIRKTSHLEIDIHCKPTTTDTTIHSTSIHPIEHKLASYRYYIERMLSSPLNTEKRNREWATILHIA